MKKSTPSTPNSRARKTSPTTLRFDQGKDVRAIARERVGTVKPAQVIKDKKQRKKPKHKLPAGVAPEAE
jgi:hypothetical protein